MGAPPFSPAFGERVGTGFSYDGMGNVTLDNLGNSYTYDAEGRPLTAAGVQTYYDAFNRAVGRLRG